MVGGGGQRSFWGYFTVTTCTCLDWVNKVREDSRECNIMKAKLPTFPLYPYVDLVIIRRCIDSVTLYENASCAFSKTDI